MINWGNGVPPLDEKKPKFSKAFEQLPESGIPKKIQSGVISKPARKAASAECFHKHTEIESKRRQENNWARIIQFRI